MSRTADGLGLALGGLRRLADLDILDRPGVRPLVDAWVQSVTRNGFGAGMRIGTQVSRTGRFLGWLRTGAEGDPARQTVG